jgi:hypothetical protein
MCSRSTKKSKELKVAEISRLMRMTSTKNVAKFILQALHHLTNYKIQYSYALRLERNSSIASNLHSNKVCWSKINEFVSRDKFYSSASWFQWRYINNLGGLQPEQHSKQQIQMLPQTIWFTYYTKSHMSTKLKTHRTKRIKYVLCTAPAILYCLIW